MDVFASGWAQIAWAHCWQVTLLIALVWLILRCVGQDRPHLACALWLVVILKCVMPPVLSSPSGVFCWLQPVTDREVSPTTRTADRGLAATHGDEAIEQAARPVPTTAASSDAPMPLSLSALQPLPAASSWHWPSFASALMVAWFLGALLYANVTAARWWKCWRLLQASVPASPELLARMDGLCRQFGVHRKVRVLVTDSLLGPAVVGLWRPTIVLPAALLTAKSPNVLEPLLAHELNHIRRGDLWVGLLQAVAGGLWWFHPLVRLAIRWATRESERCCDEEVIARLGCSPVEYARSLLDVLAMRQQLISIPAFPGVRPVDVTSQRLERIMKLGQGCQCRSPWWCWLLTLALIMAALPGAAFVAGAKERAMPNTQDPKQYIGSDLGGEEDQAAELSERTYEVSKILESLRSETAGTEESARLLLEQLVKSAAPGPWTGNQRSTVRWVGVTEGKLHLRQSALGHRRVEEQLAVLQEHGYAELSVEVLIISGPKAVLEVKGIDWRMIGSQESSATGLAADVDPRDAVRTVVEKHLPAVVAQVDHKKVLELVAAAQSDPQSNAIQAPKVTLHNGQAARVEDTVQRPFVVGVQPKAQTGGMALQPTVRVFCEGTRIRLRPVAKKNGRVQLDFALTLSSIRDVDTADFPAGLGEKPFTVQVPEVATTRLSTVADLNDEQALVLSLPKTNGGQRESQPMCIVVKVRKLAGGLTPVAQQVTQPRSHADIKLQHEGAKNGQLDLEHGEWRLRLSGENWKQVSSNGDDGKGQREIVINGDVRLEAFVKRARGERSEQVYAQTRSAQILMRDSPDARSPITISLDGEVQMWHDKTQIAAKQVVLRFVSGLTPSDGTKPATLELEIRDAKSLSLPSKHHFLDEIQWFPPGPERPNGKVRRESTQGANLTLPVPANRS